MFLWFLGSCYLCAELPEYRQRLVIQEVSPFDLTAFLRVESSKLGQCFLFLLIRQILVKQLLGDKVPVLQ